MGKESRYFLPSGVVAIRVSKSTNISGKKGYPKYSKHTHSVEFKKSGWKLNRDAKKITFTDGKKIGELKLIGSRDLFYWRCIIAG